MNCCTGCTAVFFLCFSDFKAGYNEGKTRKKECVSWNLDMRNASKPAENVLKPATTALTNVWWKKRLGWWPNASVLTENARRCAVTQFKPWRATARMPKIFASFAQRFAKLAAMNAASTSMTTANFALKAALHARKRAEKWLLNLKHPALEPDILM
mgnify:CR=1 FL=1